MHWHIPKFQGIDPLKRWCFSLSYTGQEGWTSLTTTKWRRGSRCEWVKVWGVYVTLHLGILRFVIDSTSSRSTERHHPRVSRLNIDCLCNWVQYFAKTVRKGSFFRGNQVLQSSLPRKVGNPSISVRTSTNGRIRRTFLIRGRKKYTFTFLQQIHCVDSQTY